MGICDSYNQLNNKDFTQAAAKCGMTIAVGAAADAAFKGGLPGALV